MQAVSLSFFRFDDLRARLWAFSQMRFARPLLSGLPDIGFHKLFGTGTGEGFTPAPNFGAYAIMATWPSLAIARERVEGGEVFARYRRHAGEQCTVYLSAVSTRGRWDAREPFEAEPEPELPRPIAVLTRATLKTKHLLDFWRNTPGISVTVREQDRLRFKIGMGEAPLLQQVTFSIWDDPDAMKAFAYGSASHAAAIRGVRSNGWFKEELYARFKVLGTEGTWQGREPLAA